MGDNIQVSDVDGVATVSVDSPEQDNLSVYDEGDIISNVVKALNFVGAGVYLRAQTLLGDWITLSDVTTLDMNLVNPNTVEVVIDGVSESANYLLVFRTLDEPIIKNRLVSASSGSNVVIASSSTEVKSRVLGLCLETGAAGDLKPILLLGNQIDVSFTFGLNKPLYLTVTGGMQEVPPTEGWITPVAFSNGAGSVFIQPKEPMELG